MPHTPATDLLAKDIMMDLRTAQYSNGALRAVAIQRAAEKMVELRSHFTNAKGEPDWQGRTWDYRQLVSDIYNGAGLEAEANSRVKTSLRYYIGQVLRERLTKDELRDAGLLKDSPRSRTGMRYRESGNDAEFMHAIILHMYRTPNQPLTKKQHKRANNIADDLTRWLHNAALVD